MKFLIDRASLGADDVKPCEGAIKLDGGGYGIKLHSLDDLMYLVKNVGHPVIIYDRDENVSIPFIQIYDDYIE